MRDLENRIGPVLLLEPQDLAYTDTASSILDLQGFEGAAIVAVVGALTGVDGSNYLTPTLQESDTTADADFDSVATADIVGGFTKIDSTSEDSVVQTAGYVGTKRYIRVKFDYTGTSISAGIVGAVGIVGNAKTEPVTAPAAVAAT
jgi:hypothetical protein